jgi:hypothetical protein
VPDGVSQLIARIDEAVTLRDPDAITQRIKQERRTPSAPARSRCPRAFHRLRPDSYARRLLHRNDALGYTAVVMTWGPASARRCTITPASGASKGSSKAAWTSRGST